MGWVLELNFQSEGGEVSEELPREEVSGGTNQGGKCPRTIEMPLIFVFPGSEPHERCARIFTSVFEVFWTIFFLNRKKIYTIYTIRPETRYPVITIKTISGIRHSQDV